MTNQAETRTKESAPQPSAALSLARFPVVGIVGTAGSRQALRLFFRNLPEDSGMAFILVTRLASRHIQALPGLLQQQTDMPVVIASDDVRLQPDHVYIAPAGKQLLVDEGRICLVPFTEMQNAESTHGLLDAFLLSLVKSQGEDTIAILLSGTGTDGVAGLVQTAASAGLVMIQDPDEAAHPALPRRAMAACPNGLVATAGEMVRQLVQIRGDLAEQPAAFKPDVSEPIDSLYAAVLQQIFHHTGHDLSHYKASTLHRRIASRMASMGIPSLARYVELLKNNAEETVALFHSSLVSVTSFFRDPDAHEMLGNDCIPQLFAEKKRNDVVRVWVAGCATGQEAYSIAIHLAEYAAQLDESPRLQVFATDLDEEAIAFARRGVYPKTIAKEMSAGRLERFFTAHEDGYQVKAAIREHMLFAVHDLFKDPPFSRLDLVSCRNVLIYFNRAAQAKLLEIFHYALNPQPDPARAKSGLAHKYLFLGTSESVDAAPELFAVLDKQCHLYLRNEVAISVHRRLPTTRLPTASERIVDRVRQSKTPSTRTIEELYTNWSLRVHLPPRLLVNSSYEITHLFGTVAPFLHEPEGAVTQNILQRVRPELLLDLRSALYQAFNKGERSCTHVLRLEDKDATRLVRLHVGPITEPGFPEGYVEILFAPETEGESEEFASVEAVETDLVLVRRLEEELTRTRERLQRVLEEYDNSDQELKIANQELQSVNEELKFTTEELETSKEELQSMNEELITVNSDLLEKIDELHRINSDLSNLIASTDVGAIFLDTGLRVKRFTPRATDLFNVLAGDLDRPFAHITHRIRHANLPALATRVEELDTRIEETVQRDDDRWYSLRLFPYRTVKGEREGVVITFVDINDLKRAESEERQRIQQQMLAQLGRHALEEGDLDNLLFSTIQQVAVVLDLEMCKLLQIQADGGPLLLRTGVGWQEGLVGVATVPVDAPSQAGYTLLSVEPVVVRDFETETRFLRSPLLADHDVRSGISVTLFGPDGPYGVLSFHSRTPRIFATYDVDFVQSVANTLAAAIARQQATEQVRASEARFRAIADYTYDWESWIGPDGHPIWINPAVERLTGWTAEECLCMADYPLPLIHPADRGQMAAYFDDALAGGSGNDYSFRVQRKSGEYTWFAISWQPIINQGLQQGYRTSVRDISERKQAEDAMRASEAVAQRYVEMIEASYDSIIVWSPTQGIEFWNQGAEELYGYRADEVIGQATHQLLATSHPQPFDKILQTLAQTGEWEGELVHTTKAGQKVIVSTRHQLIQGQHGAPMILEINRDITDRKQAEADQQLLTSVAEKIRLINDADSLIQETLGLVGEHLQIGRCFLIEIDLEHDRGLIRSQYCRGLPPVASEFQQSDYSPTTRADLQAGRVVVNYDTKLDPRTAAYYDTVYAPEDERAYIGVPLHYEGSWRGILSVTSATPRQWQPHEVRLLESVGERLWLAVEKLRLNESLRAREAQLQLATIVAGLGIAEVDYVTNHIHLDAESAKLFGLADEAITLPRADVHAVVHPEDSTELWELIQQALDPTSSGELAMEHRVVWPDGQVRWLSVRERIFFSYPIDASAHPVYGLLVAVDITERKQAEETLRRQEAFLREIADNIPGLVGYMGADEHYRFANAAFESWFQLPRQQILEGTALMLLGQYDYTRLSSYRLQALAGEIVSFEEQLTYPDGITRHIWSRYQPDFAEDGSVLGFYIFVMDISERKAAEEALRANEAQLNAILQNIPAAVYMLTPDHRYLYVNRYYEQANQIANREIQGQSIYDRFPLEIADELATNERQVLERKIPMEWEESAPRTDGIRHYATVKAPLLHPNGEPYAILGVSIDITERKRAEAALRISQERLEIAAEAAELGVFELDLRQGTILWENDRIYEIFGHTREDGVISQEAFFTSYIHPDDEDAVVQALQAASTPGAKLHVVCRLRRKDHHEYCWVETTAKCTATEEGASLKLVGVIADITERKETESALYESLARLDTILQNVPASVYMLTPDQRYIYVNRYYEQLAHIKNAEIQGKSNADMFPPEVAALLTANDQLALASKVAIEREETTPDQGQIRTFASVKIPLLDAEGEPYALLGISTDITERKQSERVQQFLLDLDTQTRLIEDADAILEKAAEYIGRYLKVGHCTFNEVDLANDRGVVLTHWRRSEELPLMIGTHQISSAIGTAMADLLLRGQSVTVNDVLDDSRTQWLAERYRAIDVRSIARIPFLLKGTLVAILAVADSRPRIWRQDEIALLETVIARVWPLVVKARAEQALRVSAERLQLATQAGGVGIFDHDLLTNQTEFSEIFSRITGFPSDGLLTREAWLAIIHPEDRSLVATIWDESTHTGNSYYYECRIVRPDDRPAWIEVNALATTDGAGRSIRITGAVRDITERKQTALHQQFLLDLNSTLRTLNDPTLIQQTVVHRLCEYLGASRCRFNAVDLVADKAMLLASWSRPGLAPAHDITPLSIYASSAYIAGAQAGRTLVVDDANLDDRPELKPAHFRDRGFPATIRVPCLRDREWVASLHVLQDQPRHWRPDEVQLMESVVHHFWPLVEKARVEEALRESEARYRYLFETMDEGFCVAEMILDEQGNPADYRFLEANPAFEEFTDLHQVVGRTVRELVPDPEAYGWETYGQVALSGEPIRFELGSEVMGRWFSVYAFRVGGEESRRVAILLMNITERKQSELSLARNNVILSGILESSSDAIFVRDLSGRYLLINSAGAEQVGMSKEAMIGKSYQELFPEDADVIKQNDRPILEQGLPYTTEQVSERNGVVRHWNTLKMPLRTADGQTIGLVSSARDMTEWKRAEDELRRAYEVLALAQRISQSGVWDWDIVHEHTFWSPEYYDLYGIPGRTAPSYEAWIATIHPDDRGRIAKRLQEMLQSDGNWQEEFRILHPQRGERWLLGIGQVAYDEAGHAARFTGINLDITERKTAEGVLARYQLLSEQTRDIILFIRQNGQIVEANAAALEAYGYDRETLLRLNISDLRHPATRMQIAEQMAQASQESEGHGVRFETIHLRQDGRSFPVEVSSVSTQVAGEQLLLSVIRDISERKAAEVALAASEAKFSTAFSLSPLILTISLLADGRLIEVNEGFLRTTGYTRDQVLGRTPDELELWVNPEERKTGLAQLAEGKTVQDIEAVFRMKNGELRTCLLGATRVEIDGQLCALTALTDITERKAAEAQIKYQAFLLENVGDAILSTDMNLRIRTWNRSAEQVYGWSAAEVIGQQSRNLLRTTYIEGETSADGVFKQLLQEERWQGEVIHTHKNGRKLFISNTTTLLRDEAGNPTGAVAVNRDITEHKQAEERLRFMADASSLLASSLDYRVTLENVAHAAVPNIADWCVIDLLAPDGSLTDAALVHIDPEKVRWAKTLRQRYPVDPEAPAGAPNVIRTGKSEFYPEITHAMLAAVAKNDEELDLLRAVGYRSIMIVPLRSHEHILGAITFVISESERRFIAADLQMAEDLALRAASAIENAQLYQAVRLRESELRVSEERFRSAFEQAAVGMAHLNADGYYQRVNDRLCEILGYNRQELLQMSYMDVTHADDLAADLHLAKRLLVGEIMHYSMEKRYICKDGRAIWSNITVSAVRDDQNQVKYTIVVVEDISARKAAEEAVRQSEELARQRLVELEAIYNTAPIGLCVLDRDLRWQRINKHLAEMNGYSVAEHLGHTVGELLPDVASTVEPILRAILETGKPLPNIELRGETPSQPGVKRIWLEHMFPLQDRDGIITGINIVAEEITERKRQESHQQFLSELGMQLRLMSDSDAILKHLVDRLGEYLQVTHCRVNEIDLVNDQFAVQKNWAADGENTHGVFPLAELAPSQILNELRMGRTVIVDNTVTDPRTAAVADTYRSQQTSALIGVPIFHEGQWWATLSVRERGERHWRPDEVALLETVSNQLRDLLEKARAEEALRRLNATLEQRVAERTAELERSNRELDQFAYIASHDLKAPLRGIENLANWISEDAEPLLPPTSAEHLRKLRSRVDRMEKLLEDLLIYSRANRIRGTRSTVNLGTVVDDVIEFLAPPDGYKVLRSAEMPVFITYRAPLDLVLRNLIGNAIKHHHRQDGEIQITVEERDDFFEVSVRDDGPGIAPEFHERIFGMFQTLRPRDEVEASGIGLAVVKRTVESLGGKVWVESALGEGSTFHFTWPKKIDGVGAYEG